MIELNRMILIGGMEKNAGKTTFSETVIKKVKTPIIGVKVTIFRGDRDFKKYLIQEETDPNRSKDSSRLLAAGAKRVFWIKTDENQVQKAMEELLESIPKETAILCESNSLRKFVKPSLFIMVEREKTLSPKATAMDVVKFADQTVKTSLKSDKITYSPDLSTKINFTNGIWKIEEI
jgi:molybdopterin-guanine dinucleotide biosynthesis protein